MIQAQYDYLVMTTDQLSSRGLGNIGKGLNQLGMEGWELVAVDSGVFYFKMILRKFSQD